MVYHGFSEPTHNTGMEIINCRSHCIPSLFYKSTIGAFAQEVENIYPELSFCESMKMSIFTGINEKQKEVLSKSLTLYRRGCGAPGSIKSGSRKEQDCPTPLSA